jgi:hypothetical protein
MMLAAGFVIIAINQLAIFMLVRELRKSAELRDKRLDFINTQIDVHNVEMKIVLETMRTHDALPEDALVRLANAYEKAAKTVAALGARQ